MMLYVCRFIYLDNDVIATSDIEELWSVDLQGNILGANRPGW